MSKNSKDSIYEAYAKHVNSSYPAFLERLGIKSPAMSAEGATITDADGKTYIDCTGGYGLFNLGHNNPEIIKALKDLLDEHQQFNKPLITQEQVDLAAILAQIAPGDLNCSFLCNSGSEAIDCALKLARLSQKRSQIIAFQGSWHGYTFGALSASGIDAQKQAYEPLVPDILHIPFGDDKALESNISPDTAAVIIEAVQHEAGIGIAPTAYLKKLREICDKQGVLLILDEIKTGLGKTGKMFACEHYGIVPDILVLGKSLGGGLIPIGAVLSSKKLWRKFSYSFSMSASSFAGNVLACTAAKKTIELLLSSEIVRDGVQKGIILDNGLNVLAKRYPEIILSITGMGLLWCLFILDDGTAFNLSKSLVGQGFLCFPAFSNRSALMIEPALVITDDQINQLLTAINHACQSISKNT